jgi:hypothetical protein
MDMNAGADSAKEPKKINDVEAGKDESVGIDGAKQRSKIGGGKDQSADQAAISESDFVVLGFMDGYEISITVFGILATSIDSLVACMGCQWM